MIKTIYVTQRVYDECSRNTFGAKQTDTKTTTIRGNIFLGIPIVINNNLVDPPGILLIRDDGTIVYPKIVDEEKE